VAARASQELQGAPAFQQLQATAVPRVRARVAVDLAPARVVVGPMREAMAALRARQETALRAQAARVPMRAVMVPPAAAYQ
jgi:hypothetical protein